MPKPSTPRALAGAPTRSETMMEKTTRAAWDIIDDETAKRDRKTEQLREARLARAAETTVDPEAPIAKTARKITKAKPDKSS